MVVVSIPAETREALRAWKTMQQARAELYDRQHPVPVPAPAPRPVPRPVRRVKPMDIGSQFPPSTHPRDSWDSFYYRGRLR